VSARTVQGRLGDMCIFGRRRLIVEQDGALRYSSCAVALVFAHLDPQLALKKDAVLSALLTQEELAALQITKGKTGGNKNTY
jgi:hypothetical protein